MTSLTRRRTLGALTGLALGSHALPFAAYAQDFPSRPMKLFAPIAPGGLTDTLARALATRVGERIGQPMVVENRPGGGGVIGMQAAARSPADGYSLILVYQGVASVNPVLLKNPPYDTMRDFVPVALVARAPLYLAVHPNVPAGTLPEFLDYARARPGKVNYGSSGIGSTHHLTMEALKHDLRLDLVHVPFKGTGQSVPALIGGQVEVLWSAYPSLAGFVKDGRVKLLASNGGQRSAQAPNVPTIAETIPGFDFAPIVGVLAPAGTPRPIIDRLNAELNKAVSDPSVAANLNSQSLDPMHMTPDEFAKLLKTEYDKYEQIVKLSGATLD